VWRSKVLFEPSFFGIPWPARAQMAMRLLNGAVESSRAGRIRLHAGRVHCAMHSQRDQDVECFIGCRCLINPQLTDPAPCVRCARR
jgi:hypothetical protein